MITTIDQIAIESALVRPARIHGGLGTLWTRMANAVLKRLRHAACRVLDLNTEFEVLD
jgi:hypothetical protein